MLSRIPNWLKNKYLLSTAFFSVWMLFFDHNDLFQQLARLRELRELKDGSHYYEEQLSEVKKELRDLRTNPSAMEAVARERYLMKKPDEVTFVIRP